MKSLLVRELREKRSISGKNACEGKAFTLERVRRFQEADEKLQEACARLGIEKPNMIS
jgi:hypothetical protein